MFVNLELLLLLFLDILKKNITFLYKQSYFDEANKLYKWHLCLKQLFR